MTFKKSIIPLALLISACTMAPEYTRPDLLVSNQWPTTQGYESATDYNTQSRVSWTEFFQSTDIQTIIQTALKNNHDLKIATLNIEQARALYRIERADLVPSINAKGTASFSQGSKNIRTTNSNETQETSAANLSITSYEIDLFGKIQSLNDAALNDYLSTAEATNSIRNTLIAETANAYLQLLADQKLLSLTQKTLEAQNKTYNLLKASFTNGIATELDVARAQTAVENAQVNVHQYQRFVELDRNALVVLLGISDDNFTLPKGSLDTVKILKSIAPSLPSDVLLLRPDIRQAEYALIARNADIGAARAAFFPSITLTGQYGLASDSLSSLFSHGTSGAWSFLPTITLPIFQGGRNLANLDIAEIRKEQSIISYEKAIQNGFKEVSDALISRASLDKQLTAQKRLVGAAQKVYDLSNERYKSGIDNFLSVLDAQRELYSAEQAKIQLEQQRFTNLVNLYKSLGGGAI